MLSAAYHRIRFYAGYLFSDFTFLTAVGMVVYFGRVSRFKPLSWIVKAYISIMRGTPLMLQLLVVYFGPYYIFGMRVGNSYRLWAVFIGFVINYAAYFAEIYAVVSSLCL